MRSILQRVHQATVTVDGASIGSISRGYVLFLGVMHGDTEVAARWLAAKIVKLRLFDGADGKVNDRSVLDIAGEVLVISQFTLAGDTAKGNRPDYTAAEAPERAKELYDVFLQALREEGVRHVAAGIFGAHMQVALTNDGPVTLFLEKLA